MEDVLDYWFGAPARTSEDLHGKILRWFANGAALDAEIKARFGARLEAALGGHFEISDDPWSRLVTIIVLDQFPRHVYRGTPRMYAGDRFALSLSLDGVERGMHATLTPEARIFFAMPLSHAEDLAHQTRAVALAEALAKEAPEPLRAALGAGARRAAHYRNVIERFGRFPARNAILGRRSTPAELEYLADGDAGPAVVVP